MKTDNLVQILVSAGEQRKLERFNIQSLNSPIFNQVYTDVGDKLFEQGFLMEARFCYETAKDSERLYEKGRELFCSADAENIEVGAMFLKEYLDQMFEKDEKPLYPSELGVGLASYQVVHNQFDDALDTLFCCPKDDPIVEELAVDLAHYSFNQGDFFSGMMILKEFDVPLSAADLHTYSFIGAAKGDIGDVIKAYISHGIDVPNEFYEATLDIAIDGLSPDADVYLSAISSRILDFLVKMDQDDENKLFDLDEPAYQRKLGEIAKLLIEKENYSTAIQIYSHLPDKLTSADYLKFGKHMILAGNPNIAREYFNRAEPSEVEAFIDSQTDALVSVLNISETSITVYNTIQKLYHPTDFAIPEDKYQMIIDTLRQNEDFSTLSQVYLSKGDNKNALAAAHHVADNYPKSRNYSDLVGVRNVFSILNDIEGLHVCDFYIDNHSRIENL